MINGKKNASAPRREPHGHRTTSKLFPTLLAKCAYAKHVMHRIALYGRRESRRKALGCGRRRRLPDLQLDGRASRMIIIIIW